MEHLETLVNKGSMNMNLEQTLEAVFTIEIGTRRVRGNECLTSSWSEKDHVP